MFGLSLFRPSRQSNISTSGEERFKYPLPRENKISQMPYPGDRAVYEEVYTGSCGARLFFADYSKGFDMIDHSVLIEELRNMHVHPVLVNWIKAFLCNRTQAVRIENIIFEWKTPKGGIPQGTKLGVILFTIMTNNLLRSWNLRIKFVDDTTALEIVPRNSAVYSILLQTISMLLLKITE